MPQQSSTSVPSVIVISSHVVRGSVGNRAAAFALEVLSFPTCIVPTVTLPWHPGHGVGTRIVAPKEQFDALIDDLANAPWLHEVGAVLSGYLGDHTQAPAIAKLVSKLKQKNKRAIYLCDPVLGDNGKLYVPPETATSIRDHLIPLADIITPNLFELSWLCRSDEFETNEEAIAAANTLAPETTLITSAHPMMKGAIGTILLDKDRALMSEHRLVTRPDGKPLNGVGDLTSALYLAHHLKGEDAETTLRVTTASVSEVIQNTVRQSADELALESNATSLIRPVSPVQLRSLSQIGVNAK